MGGGVEGHPGGIGSLLELIEQHEGAVLYDLLNHGYTAADLDAVPYGRLSWREMLAIIRHQEPSGKSAVFRAVHPKSWGYSLEVQAIMSLQPGDWEVPSDDEVTAPERQLPKPADIRARLKAVDAEIASRTA